ncbi:MAG: tRNA (N(6)-L-threonylcarbamoyladenosine(37)-C(2))-methylthiotransferase MtaB [Candidatus Marinimicrobia bacterium]|nr:tRNA (N(6)-L-threonylcarbamoyladenosine(37)-C(2))-methylthiotransferase MtaB [Candidatus Neomarinimicrobiota bacterium]
MDGEQKTVSFYTLGCKLNQAETSAIRNKFDQNGFTIIPFGKSSDITIINTCIVTNRAAKKSRNIIRQAKRISPDGKIVAVGCYSQVDWKKLKNITEIDMILGNKEKFQIIENLAKLGEDDNLKIAVDTIKSDEYFEKEFTSTTERTRAILKVQTGCDKFCSYCIVPYARGLPASRNFTNSVNEAKDLVKNGFKEIVLTGIDIGSYFYKGKKLIDLIREIEKIDGIKRIRISSIELNSLSDELILHIANSKIAAPHFHLSLQSGSDEILKKMRRRYSTADFFKKVNFIRKHIPNVSIGTDVIVGFPGESEELFNETYEFIKKVRFNHLHIFRYSRKEGTPAAKMPDQVDEKLKKRRSKKLRELEIILKTEYIKKFFGENVSVLWEKYDGVFLSGLSEHYLKVKAKAEVKAEVEVKSKKSLVNEFSNVYIIDGNVDHLEGKIG